MSEILQAEIPQEMRHHWKLPGVQPLNEPWLRVDDAYSAQMAHRRHLLATRRADVHFMEPEAGPASEEALEEALKLLPALGFSVSDDVVTGPDGIETPLRGDAPLALLGRMVQEDICIMEKRGAEHVLTAAVLCFPAS